MMRALIQSLPSLNSLGREAVNTVRRFPFALLAAILAVGAAFRAINLDIEPDEAKLSLTLALGIPLFLASALLREAKGWSRYRYLFIDFALGASFLFAHYFLTKGDTTENYILRYLQVSLALHLLVSFVAFANPRAEQEFWQFNRFVFLRILLSGLYAGVVFIGLTIALVTISKLFSVQIKSSIYAKLWIISALVFQTWHFLAGIPRLQDLKTKTHFPRGLRYFVQFVLIPLVSIYMVILYCYMAKVLITHHWPSGYIGWLVSIMSAVGIFNLLLIDPEKNNSENRWIRAYSKSYYVLILPLLGMLFIAIGKRISEYGITEERYFLSLFGALIAGLAAYFIFSKTKNIKAIPISFFAIMILTLSGPWSAYSLSLHSQKSRAQNILEKNEFLREGATRSARNDVPPLVQRELSSIFDYLLKNHGLDAVAEWFPPATLNAVARSNDGTSDSKSSRHTAHELMKYLGLTYTDRWQRPSNANFSFKSDAKVTPLDIEPFRHALNVEFNSYTEKPNKAFQFQGRTLTLKIEGSNALFTIIERSYPIVSLDLAASVQKVRESNLAGAADDDHLLPNDLLSVEAKNASLNVRLVIYEINGEYENDRPVIKGIKGLILFR